MREFLLPTAAALAAVLLAGCGTSEPDEPPAERASIIGQPLQQSLDRAQAVQDTIDERAEALRRQLEADEGSAR